jgi:large subunit ribosomal protein L15
MMLHDVNQGIHKHKKKMRIGRGIGSGKGKTSGRGHKGQLARAGYKALPIWEGTTSPLVRRVPKRGFTNSFALKVLSINVGDLDELFASGDSVSPEILQSRGILKKRFDVLKILGDGEVTKKLTISAHRFSAQAKEKIEKAGGSVTIIPGRTPVEDKKAAVKAKKKAGKS